MRMWSVDLSAAINALTASVLPILEAHIRAVDSLLSFEAELIGNMEGGRRWGVDTIERGEGKTIVRNDRGKVQSVHVFGAVVGKVE